MARKWSMGLVLQLQANQFNATARNAERTVKQFNATRKSGEEITTRNMQAYIRNQRAMLAKTAGAAVALLASFTMVARGLVRLTKNASEYQYQTSALTALLKEQEGVGRKMYITFRQMNPQIREFAPADVVQRMRQLAMAGYNTNEIMTSMGAILNTVTASMGTLSTEAAVNLGINLDRGFGNATTTMEQLLDTAVTAANQFPMSVGNIADAMGYATEAAIQYDQSLKETLLTIGLLVPITKTAVKAGTAYRKMLLNLASNKTGEFLEKHGIAVKDHAGKMRAALDIYLDIKKTLDKIGKNDKTKLGFTKEQFIRKIGGVRGGSVFAALEKAEDTIVGRRGSAFEGKRFDSAGTALLALRMGFGSAGGEAKRLAEDLRETSRILKQRLQASITETSIAIGEIFRPLVDDLVIGLTSLSDWVGGVLGGGVTGPGMTDKKPGYGPFVRHGAALGALSAMGALFVGGGAMMIKAFARIIRFAANPMALALEVQQSLVAGAAPVAGLKSTLLWGAGIGAAVVALGYLASQAHSAATALQRENNARTSKDLDKEGKNYLLGFDNLIERIKVGKGGKVPLDKILALNGEAASFSGGMETLMRQNPGWTPSRALGAMLDHRRIGVSSSFPPGEKDARDAELKKHDALATQVMGQARRAEAPFIRTKEGRKKLGVTEEQLLKEHQRGLGNSSPYFSGKKKITEGARDWQARQLNVDLKISRTEFEKEILREHPAMGQYVVDRLNAWSPGDGKLLTPKQLLRGRRREAMRLAGERLGTKEWIGASGTGVLQGSYEFDQLSPKFRREYHKILGRMDKSGYVDPAMLYQYQMKARRIGSSKTGLLNLIGLGLGQEAQDIFGGNIAAGDTPLWRNAVYKDMPNYQAGSRQNSEEQTDKIVAAIKEIAPALKDAISGGTEEPGGLWSHFVGLTAEL